MNDDKTLVRNTPALFALKNIKTGEFHEIYSKASIGRQEDCTIRLDEGHVSRLHASLKMSHDKLLLKDEGSENGTFVNGVKISEVVLRPGDKIKFDIHEFTVLSVNKELADDTDKATLIQTKVDAPAQHQEQDSAATLIMPSTQQDEDAAKTLIMPSPSKAQVAETVIMGADDAIKQTRIQNTQVLPEDEGYFYEPEEDYAEEEATSLFGYHPLVFDKIFPLVKEVVVVGKSPRADIVLKDASVSSEHAEIFWENGYWGLEDMGSTNGTYLNGQEIFEPVILAPGDVIQFGLIQLVFAQPEPAFYYETQSGNMKWLVIAGIAFTVLAAIIGLLTFTD